MRSTSLSYLLIAVCSAAGIAGCFPRSEHIADQAVGLNGSFEIDQNGLPVNWLVYTPNTIKDADFLVILIGTFTRKDTSRSNLMSIGVSLLAGRDHQGLPMSSLT